MKFIFSKNSQESLKIYSSFLAKYRVSVIYILFGLTACVISVIACLLIPRISGNIVDHAIADGNLPYLYRNSAILLSFFFLSIAMNYAHLYILQRESELLLIKVKKDVFYGAILKPWLRLASLDQGYLMSRIEDDAEQLKPILPIAIINLIFKLIRLAVVVGILYCIKPIMLVLCTVFLVIAVMLGKYGGPKITYISTKIREQQAQKNSVLHGILSNFPLVRMAGKTDEECIRFEDELNSYFRINMHSRVLRLNLSSSGSFLFGVPTHIILLVGGMMVIRGNMTLGTLIAIQLYYQQLAGITNELININFNFHSSFVSLKRIHDFLKPQGWSVGYGDNASIRMLSQGKDNVPIKPSRVASSLRFDNISFEYKKGQPVFSGVTFQIEPGAKVALVGASGAGKTTIVRLILKQALPTTGRIFFDGVPLGDLSEKELFDRIGYVPQTISLFNRSLHHNLTYRAKVNCSDDELIARLHDFGLKTIDTEILNGTIEEAKEKRGQILSGGELQIFAILRELLASPSFIIWDEASCSMDSASELNVFTATEKYLSEKTMLLISHRLSTIKKADKIIVLHGGELIAQGTSHEELLENCGYYRTLFADQCNIERKD
ncbi:hypothetical protein LCGC14_1712740 [marine sediment metagenome]|uniref:ABC transporter domain-containing protein n=1 Tax=marine sediment metagenome TaxID=412755 RepID=A0A0F9HEC9_9ZZZZ